MSSSVLRDHLLQQDWPAADSQASFISLHSLVHEHCHHLLLPPAPNIYCQSALPAGIWDKVRCGSEGHGIGAVVGMGWWLDWMTSVVFSNINDSAVLDRQIVRQINITWEEKKKTRPNCNILQSSSRLTCQMRKQISEKYTAIVVPPIKSLALGSLHLLSERQTGWSACSLHAP